MEEQRQVTREVEVYNLDAAIAVGYRVNSIKATHFRIWAIDTLREFIVKGGMPELTICTKHFQRPSLTT